VALERGLGVELELMDVDVLAEQLAERLDQPRMTSEQPERLVEGVRRKGGARRAGFFAPHLLAARVPGCLRVAAQQCDLFLGKAVREEQIALLVEFFELSG